MKDHYCKVDYMKHAGLVPYVVMWDQQLISSIISWFMKHKRQHTLINHECKCGKNQDILKSRQLNASLEATSLEFKG